MNKQLTYLPIEKLIPHPDNPRKQLGDLTELADNIRQSGVYQNLTVVPDGENYKIIIGHRRRAAAELAGLKELPCIIADMSYDEQIIAMYVENGQRSDLTIVEQAQAMQMMLDIGLSVDEIAKKTGFSKTTVNKRLIVAELPKEAAKEAEERGGRLEDFIKLSRIEDESSKNYLLTLLGTKDFEWNFNRILKKQVAERNRPFILRKFQESNMFLLPNGYYSPAYEQKETVYFNDEDFNSELDFEIEEKYDNESHGYWVFEDYFVIKKKLPKQQPKPYQKSEKEQQADKARHDLQEKFKQMYKLRWDFINNFTAHKKYRDEIIKALAFYTIRRSEDMQYYYDRKYLAETIGYADETMVIKRIDCMKSYADNPEIVFTALVGSFEDKETASCINLRWGEMFPEYQKNNRLSDVYEILCSLGYQLSTEEQQLLDGTHELYKRS